MSLFSKESFSLEFFPPRDQAGRERLVGTAKQLQIINPNYVSVTFGAGGSTREGTAETVRLFSQMGYEAAPHLSCIGADKASICQILDAYRAEGVKRLVALRGDLPSGMGVVSSDLRHASDLVQLVREHSGDWFHIEVAAYPEMHPQAQGFEQDIEHFVQKVRAGADSAITQYFFNADAYFSFVDRVRAKGVDIPIVPGIMPITNHTQLVRFSQMCGAEIPRWIRLRLAEFGDDKQAIRQFGAEVVTKLCQALIDKGAPGIHFYTLNNAEATLSIWENLSY